MLESECRASQSSLSDSGVFGTTCKTKFPPGRFLLEPAAHHRRSELVRQRKQGLIVIKLPTSRLNGWEQIVSPTCFI